MDEGVAGNILRHCLDPVAHIPLTDNRFGLRKSEGGIFILRLE